MACIAEELIEIYPDNWFDDPCFDSRFPLPVSQCRLQDEEFLKSHMAELTLAGHDEWEAQFQPDWSRFWRILDDWQLDQETGEVRSTIVYASREIYEELLQWLPAWLRAEKLTQGPTETQFHFQATTWKVLRCVKMSTWHGPSLVANLFRLIHESPKPGQVQVDNVARQDNAITQVRDTWKGNYSRAFQVLDRFSRKWACVNVAADHRHDADPQLLE